PYTCYTPALVDPPEGSDLADEGYIAWALAKRLGVQMNYFGDDLDMETPPTDDLFLSILASRGNVPFDEIKREAVGGKIFEGLPEVRVLPPSEDRGRFAVMPSDVADELRAFAAT